MNPYTESLMLFPVTPGLLFISMILHISTQEIIARYELLGVTPSIAARDIQQALRHQMSPWHF